MGEVNASVSLPADPGKVWEVFSNPNNFEKWLAIHTGWKSAVPDRFEVGSQVTQVITMMGMANKIQWTVQEYDAPQHVKISGTGLAGVKVSFTLSVQPSSDGGTDATLDAEFTGQMIVGALGKAVEKDAKKNLDASMTKFTELLSRA